MNTGRKIGDLIIALRFAYRYIFVRIYRWQLIQFGPVNAPEMVGATGVSWLIWSNIFSLLIFLKYLLGIDLLRVQQTLWIAGGIFGLLYGATLYSFVPKKKYNLIAAEFKNESKADSRRRGMYVWAYTFLSVILLITSMFTAGKKPLM